MVGFKKIHIVSLLIICGVFLTGKVSAESQFGGIILNATVCTCGSNIGQYFFTVGHPHGGDFGQTGSYITSISTDRYDCEPLFPLEWVLGMHTNSVKICKAWIYNKCQIIGIGLGVDFYGTSDNNCGSAPSSKSTNIVDEIKQKRDNGEEVVGTDISTPDADEDSKSIVVKVLSARDSGNEVSGTDIEPHPEATDKSRNVVEEIVQKRDNGEEVVGTDISTPEASNGSSSTVSSILATITSGSSSTSTISNTTNSSSQNSSSNGGSSLSGQSSTNNNTNSQENISNNTMNNGNLDTGSSGSNDNNQNGVGNGNQQNNSNNIVGRQHTNNINSNTNPTASALSTSLIGIGQGGDLKEIFKVVLALVSIGIAGFFVYRAGSKSIKILFTKKIKK